MMRDYRPKSANIFQSTLLVRGATYREFLRLSSIAISIHAPRERSDNIAGCQGGGSADFNPRSSWEERHLIKVHNIICPIFQSTLLVRGATRHLRRYMIISVFQSTLLVRGATFAVFTYAIMTVYFNPRSSWEERHIVTIIIIFIRHFNPRSSWEERQVMLNDIDRIKAISIHAPRERSDLNNAISNDITDNFNPRSSWEERLH